MAASATPSLADHVRQRVGALPLDRAPLRRAGLLTLLLIALLVAGKAFGPSPARSADRQDVQAATEEVSAPGAAWTGGRVLAVLLLATGGGLAFWMHRRAGARAVPPGSTLRALETHALGPGQSLRLVACGEEVLLLSVAPEGTTLLRHWPRETFEGEPPSFAHALASAAADPPVASSTRPTTLPPPGGEGSRPSDAPTPARAGDSEAPSLGRGDSASRPYADTAGADTAGAVGLATSTTVRGTLFPPRGPAPRQFDVRHG